MQIKLTVRALALLSLGLVAACGDTAVEQALMGGGAGAATAVVLNGSVGTGAVVGAAANVAYCQKYPSRC
ncbi:hypothetical protein [Aquicoccus porphyridii]|uniref:Lipoprotein n=1 Tax=Aquicoccus porphyridii TaxID=1852029 RepID=A0A5A9ZV18_9RHOB|nr:hypothetical protein [Aquicoccus porphyridii]KAA0920772.1 hypothetical protein FLO80_00935 [Aquicoccus porphyridii]RAI56875.1 hypothetical protein DOO74_02140 [Rhodobacteraceae bacterium AsT-22]